MLLDGGESALSIRAIADAAGVSPPSIYLHFSDRNELVFAVCERHFEALHACFVDAVKGVKDPVARIRRLGEAYIRFGLENPEPYRIMFMARPDTVPDDFTPEKLEAASGFSVVVDAVQAAIDAGRFGLDDAVLGATVLWASVHGVTSLLIAKPGFPWPERKALVAAALDACERGLIKSSKKTA